VIAVVVVQHFFTVTLEEAIALFEGFGVGIFFDLFGIWPNSKTWVSRDIYEIRYFIF
jgi:hypothetical protein